MRYMRHAALAAAFLGFALSPAAAQTATPAAPAPATDVGSKPGTLSDKLSDTNGVIKPSGDVDPQMHKSTPQAGSMPVIKPGTVTPGTAK